jgi:predicted amidophosphoribosyltransferase
VNYCDEFSELKKRCCVCQSNFTPAAEEGEAAHVCPKCIEMLKGTAHAGGKGFLKDE